MSESVHKRRKRSIRQQLRDTRRLLSREDLPETVRQSKQRVLDMLVEEVSEREKTNREKKVNKRYKMVKFFEKRKLTRRLKSLITHLKTLSDEKTKETVLAEIQTLRGDLNYITHFPSGRKYIALYPNSESSQYALLTRGSIYRDILSQVIKGILPDATDCNIEPDVMAQLHPLDSTHLSDGILDDKDRTTSTDCTRTECISDQFVSNSDLISSMRTKGSIKEVMMKKGKRKRRVPISLSLEKRDTCDDKEELFVLKKRKTKARAPCDEESFDEDSLSTKKFKNDSFFM